ncbi:MAG: hypothetical protein ACNA7U_07475 [Candidatus Izemoplasmataceae bacterium]|jgi:hypothetical protein
MEKILKNLQGLFQILFYIFSILSVVAFVFYFFDNNVKFKTFGFMLLAAIGSLIIYFIIYRLYASIYKKDDYKSIPEHLDDLNH